RLLLLARLQGHPAAGPRADSGTSANPGRAPGPAVPNERAVTAAAIARRGDESPDRSGAERAVQRAPRRSARDVDGMAAEAEQRTGAEAGAGLRRAAGAV